MDKLGVLSMFVSLWIGSYTQAQAPRIVEHPTDSYAMRDRPFTFNCKAEGSPRPVVTWYRNGHKVQTSTDDPSSHRTMIGDGQLFFYTIVHNKNNKPDIGTYYCNATNRYGTALSRNATLEIAVIRDDFRLSPTAHQNVAIGSRVELGCIAPRGTPEPTIRWEKGGTVVDYIGSVLSSSGSLLISQVTRSHAGTYVCIASNVAGERRSRPALMRVYAKPKITLRPSDKVVSVNDDALFDCRASGGSADGFETKWEKEDGQLSPRARMLNNKSLKIEGVQISDEGVYKCIVTNPVGTAQAGVVLSVHSMPQLVQSLRDKSVGVGRDVSVRCVVSGNPRPAITWRKDSDSHNKIMFPMQPIGRFMVTRDGTLRITRVTKGDAGRYICKAINAVGSTYDTARIDVLDFDPRPPPVIVEGPSNQTLSVSSMAILRCETSGDPEPDVEWSKDGEAINGRNQRYTILSSGTLQISNVQPIDAGVYQCTAMSEAGETSAKASLSVTPDEGTSSLPTTDPDNLPGPPSKPVINEDGIKTNSVHLSWTKNEEEGGSPVTGYIVQFMSHELREGWIVASSNVPNPWFTVRNLNADKSYVFVVKARNSYGESLPSERSDPIFTDGGDRTRPVLSPAMVNRVQQILRGRVINLAKPEVTSSTTMNLNWMVLKADNFIEGFMIRYQPRGNNDYLETKISTNDISDFTLRDLKMYTEYEITVKPFFWTVVGEASQPVAARTKEGVPSAAPQNIVSHWGKNKTLIVKWSPPPADQQNGVIRGYKVFCLTDDVKFSKNVTTSDSSATSIAIPNLASDHEYRVQVAAYTNLGVGVKSPPKDLGKSLGASNESLVKQTWFIATLIGSIGGVLFCALLIFSICIYRKRRAAKARKKFNTNGMLTIPVHVAGDACRYVQGNSLGRTQTNGSNGYGTAGRNPPDVANVNENDKRDNYYNANKDNSDHQMAMKTFYNKNHPISEVSPYAMSNIVTGNNLLNSQNSESAFRPINRGYIKNTSEGSSDSCMKHEIHSDSNTENSRPNTGSTEVTHDEHVASPISECEIMPQEEDALLQCYLPNYRGAPPQPRVNFMDIAPPPPEYPPPSDIGTPPDTPPRGMSPAARYERSFGRTVPMQRPSPHSTIHSQKSNGSNGSRRTVNSKAGSGHHSSDNERRGLYQPARTQSFNSSDSAKSRNKNRSQSPKKYSHSSNSENERGPTPPVRAYKLVPINDVNELRVSDGERGPTPPIRMYAIHSPSSPTATCAPNMERGIQSSLPSLANDDMRSPTGARLEIGDDGPELSLFHPERDSPTSEGIPDYACESDLDVGRRTDCGSPTSSVDVGDFDNSMTGSMMASWASVTDHSDPNCSSVRSSMDGSSDGSFLAEADFASAVARAAELSGMTVVGSTVVDPHTNQGGQQRHRKRRERPKRPSSPYSTDSNFSTIPHKPYPKSQRKKQLQDKGSRQNSSGAPDPYNNSQQYRSKPPILTKPYPPQNVGDIPAYHRPNFPSPSHHSPASTNSRSTSSSGSRSGMRMLPGASIQRDNGYTGRPNPLASYNIDENMSKV